MSTSRASFSSSTDGGGASATAGASHTLRIIYLCTSNVCRSPLAEAVAADIVASRGLDARGVEVVSRGLTDGYSAWGHPAEPRMVKAAERLRLGRETMRRLGGHGSTLLQREEAADPNSLLFLVTSHHASWTAEAVGSDVLDAARAAGRLRLIDSAGGDVADPFFGGQEEYNTVAAHIVAELPRTLDAALRERGILATDEPACAPPLEVGGGGGGSGSSSSSSTEIALLEAAAAAADAGRRFGALQGGAYAPPGRN